MNNAAIEKNIEAGAKATLALAEINAKSFSTLANIQLNLVSSILKNTVANDQGIKNIKDPKAFQDYLVSVKNKSEKEVTGAIQSYVSLSKDYVEQVTKVLNPQATKTQ